MKEIQLTKGKVALVDDEDYEWLNQWKWCFHHAGYAVRTSIDKKKRTMILMHRLIIGTPQHMETDHINNNRLDNRKCNLRVCTASQNQANRPAPINNKCKNKGVYWYGARNKWCAHIWYDNRTHCIGRFNTIEEAINAYNKKSKEIFGVFAYID
jgi:hypothetical protein